LPVTDRTVCGNGSAEFDFGENKPASTRLHAVGKTLISMPGGRDGLQAIRWYRKEERL
jgi:hypothetical protein